MAQVQSAATGKKKSPRLKAAKKTIKSSAKKLPLPKEILRHLHGLMVKSRVLEERLIKIYKAGESYFWIGGPGEEAWGVPLGLLVNKGHGYKYDFLHMHYRATPTLIAMGMPMIDSIRLMMNRSTDPSTGGRNFSNHYCFPKWNVAPITSPIEVQYNIALGTARVQQRNKSPGITIVTGGDAGTAESDFATSLIWSTRPGNELPMLITVQNNRWGISTDYKSQHGETNIADRGRAFNMRTDVINGNDPIETYQKLQEHMAYIRRTGKPVLLEAKVSRLYGHSSASGANFVSELDCVREFEDKLLSQGLIQDREVKELWQRFENEARQAQETVRHEPAPAAETIWDHIYVDSENADWRNF